MQNVYSSHFKNEKLCRWCKEVKGCDDFDWRYHIRKDGKRIGYLRPYCRPCSKEYQRLLHLTRREEHAAVG